MKITIDARTYNWAGVGRYLRNLIYGLSDIDNKNSYLILLAQKDKKLFLKQRPSWLKENFNVKFIESSYYSWREQTIFWWQTRKIKSDLWHFPNFNVPLLFNKPYVVTLHDTTRFIFPGQVSKNIFRQCVYEQIFKHAVEKSRAVIHVSKSTQASLRYLPVASPHLQAVTYLGVEKIFKQNISNLSEQKTRQIIGGDFPYLLYVGVWMSHKNIPRILNAFADLPPEHRDLKLVMTGNHKPGYVNVPSLVDKLGIDKNKVVLPGHFPEYFLPALYAGARALLFPSLYEGFGLPAAEAAATGTPVITSNVSSMPEIMEDGAIYVNPENTEEISRAITKIITDQKLREEITARGKQAIQKLDWQKCARQTKEIYEKAAQQ